MLPTCAYIIVVYIDFIIIYTYINVGKHYTDANDLKT